MEDLFASEAPADESKKSVQPPPRATQIMLGSSRLLTAPSAAVETEEYLLRLRRSSCCRLRCGFHTRKRFILPYSADESQGAASKSESACISASTTEVMPRCTASRVVFLAGGG